MDANSTSATSRSTARPQRNWLARWATWAMIGVWLVSIPGVLFMWLVWQPPMGESVQNLATIALGILLTGLTLGWWFLFAPVRLRNRLILGIPVVLLIAGFLASIRHFGFKGHMVPQITFRWQTDPAERLQRHLRQTIHGERTQAAGEVVAATEFDSPAYRGAHRDGIVEGPPLNQDWSKQKPVERWRVPCGGGYGTFSLIGDQLVSLEQRGGDEALVCYDANTGKERWSHRYPASFSEAMGGDGPRSTPTIDSGRVFTMGAFGDVVCCDLFTGERHWHVNLLELFDVPNTMWAMTSSPLVVGEQVYLNIGGREGNGLVKLAVATGQLLAHSTGLQPQAEIAAKGIFRTGIAAVPLGPQSVPGYASPMLVELLGQRVLLNLDGTSLRANDPETLAQLWSFPFQNDARVNVAQPIVFDDGRIFISASYDCGAAMVQVSRTDADWSVKQLWANKNMKCKFTSPVLVNGYLYGLDEGIMTCIDPATGDRKWKGSRQGLRGRYEHGQILATNNQIVALTESGELVLIDPSPEQLLEVTTLRVLPDTKVWNPPMLSRGIVYVRCSSAEYSEMASFDLNVHPVEKLTAAASAELP